MQAAFPAKRKTVNKIPKEAAAHGAGEGSEIKAAAAAPKDSGSKTVGPRQNHWPGSQRLPQAQEGLACPPRPRHPKGPVRRQKPRACD